MKIRTDFVTNSSSSSFILSFSSEDRIDTEVNDMLMLYGDPIKQIVTHDAKMGRKFTKKEILDAAEKAVPVFGEYGIIRFDGINDEGLSNLLEEFWYKAEWETDCHKRYRGHMSWSETMDYLRSENGLSEIMQEYKSYLSKFEEYSDNCIFVEVEYEDHSEIGAMLEHDILPSKCIISFNHH